MLSFFPVIFLIVRQLVHCQSMEIKSHATLDLDHWQMACSCRPCNADEG